MTTTDDFLQAIAVHGLDGVPSGSVSLSQGVGAGELGWEWGNARRWVDADVLVPTDYLDDVITNRRADGATRLAPEIRPGFDRRFAKSVTLRSAAGPERVRTGAPDRPSMIGASLVRG